MRVLLWSRSPAFRQLLIDGASAVDGVDVEIADTAEDCAGAVAGADVLVTGDAPAGEAAPVLAAAGVPGSRLRYIHFISAGRDGFTAAGLPASVEVTGPDGAMAPTVAEHGVALLLALVRRVDAIIRAADAGTWDRSVARDLSTLEGKTVLVIGLGHIGREVARRVRSFGSYTIGLQRTARPDDSVDELGLIADLDAYLPRADVAVISASLTPETYHLINADRLAAMKATAIVVNVARGGLIDTDALVTALNSESIRGAALDVTAPEPLPDGHPLWSAKNVIVSAHFAGGGSAATSGRIQQSITDRIRALVAARNREEAAR